MEARRYFWLMTILDNLGHNYKLKLFSIKKIENQVIFVAHWTHFVRNQDCLNPELLVIPSSIFCYIMSRSPMDLLNLATLLVRYRGLPPAPGEAARCTKLRDIGLKTIKWLFLNCIPYLVFSSMSWSNRFSAALPAAPFPTTPLTIFWINAALLLLLVWSALFLLNTEPSNTIGPLLEESQDLKNLI